MRAASDESSEVRHVDEVEGADFISNLAHACEINGTGIRAPSANDQFRTFLLGQLFEGVVVDGFRFLGDAVRNDLVSLPREIEMMAVREVAAVGKVEAENSIAGLQDGSIGLHVGLRSGVRLHVGVLGAEQLLGAVASEVLDDVGELA